ncbi:hypothetical protein [Herbiconiux sp. YIM B11900]
MRDHEKINGVPGTEEQIDARAAEAEAGYDLQALSSEIAAKERWIL